MPEISIIVPVYKVEKYLVKCIDSILAQTFTDFELILVDDGSPDRCGEICDQYADKDTRIIVIHKENGGLSSARNAGLDIAKGKYISFVDSDDYIAIDMLEFLYNNMVSHNVDMSTCAHFMCYGNKIVTFHGDAQIHSVMSPAEALKVILLGGSASSCNKLFRSYIFDNIRYPFGKLYEDAWVIIDIVMKTKSIYMDTTPKYYYVNREHSITTGSFSEAQFDLISSHERICKIVSEHYPQVLICAKFRLAWAHRRLLEKIASSSKDIRNQYLKDAIRNTKIASRNIFFEVFRMPYLSINSKVANCLAAVSPRLHLLARRIINYSRRVKYK